MFLLVDMIVFSCDGPIVLILLISLSYMPSVKCICNHNKATPADLTPIERLCFPVSLIVVCSPGWRKRGFYWRRAPCSWHTLQAQVLVSTRPRLWHQASGSHGAGLRCQRTHRSLAAWLRDTYCTGYTHVNFTRAYLIYIPVLFSCENVFTCVQNILVKRWERSYAFIIKYWNCVKQLNVTEATCKT